MIEQIFSMHFLKKKKKRRGKLFSSQATVP
jgi:hypothetical protein